MMKKKLCMLGATRVGKTSLVQRFVQTIFSDKYHPTVGVKIDKKQVLLGGREVSLLLWDVQGEDETYKVRPSYLRGASGYLLVVDGTRRATFETACALQATVEGVVGRVPFMLIINKTDLSDRWDVDEAAVGQLTDRGWIVTRTSALTGQGVEEAFLALAQRMLVADDQSPPPAETSGLS